MHHQKSEFYYFFKEDFIADFLRGRIFGLIVKLQIRMDGPTGPKNNIMQEILQFLDSNLHF